MSGIPFTTCPPSFATAPFSSVSVSSRVTLIVTIGIILGNAQAGVDCGRPADQHFGPWLLAKLKGNAILTIVLACIATYSVSRFDCGRVSHFSLSFTSQ